VNCCADFGGESTLRVGVVGCGYWGSKHVRVLVGIPEVERVCAVDPRPDRRAALTKSFPGIDVVPWLDEALGMVDAVVVATPASTHAAVAREALSAGKHVLVEKPLATTVADAHRLVGQATAASLVLMVGHTFEYNAVVRQLRETVQARELGEMYYIETARLNLGIYQSDVNVVWDLAPHDVSIITYLLGVQPSAVQAWGASHAHATLEDVAHLRLEFHDQGVTGQIHVSWLYPSKVRRVTAVGSRKMAVYDDLVPGEPLRIFDKGVAAADQNGADLHAMPMSYRYGDVVTPHVVLQEPLLVEDRHFVDCVANGRRPLSDGKRGLGVVSVLDAAQRSIREGRRVQLDPEPTRRLELVAAAGGYGSRG
jgi:predicted dehydrogenase